MEEFKGIPQNCTNIIESPDFDVNLKHEFHRNKCLLNSYKAAIANNDLIVEGIVIALEDGKVYYIDRHCWNKHEDAYYDVTKDYIWTTPEFQTELREGQGIKGEISYKYLRCVERTAKECLNEEQTEIEFRYDYSSTIKELKHMINKQSEILP